MHHDAAGSTYATGGKAAHKAFAYGLNWVVLSLWLPVPWWHSGGVAIPILFRLYRQRKSCPKGKHATRTQLAKEMMEFLIPHLPKERGVVLTGDSEYSCRTLVRPLVNAIEYIGPIAMDAAVFDQPEEQKGPGRRRVRGARLPNPRALATNSMKWKKVTVKIYGREVELLTKTIQGNWYTVSWKKRGRIVVTRDPSGRLQDRAFYSTNPNRSDVEIIELFSKRWEIEVSFRNVKQHLGLQDPQNGWWRRKRGEPTQPKRPGANPRGNIGKHAIERTTPFVFYVYAITIIWFAKYGNADAVVEEAKICAPWYRHKSNPSYLDILVTIRRDLWRNEILENPTQNGGLNKIAALLPQWLLAA